MGAPDSSPRLKFRLAEIASELGLSISTVSRALSGAGRISEDTRKKVLAAAQRLHNQSELAVTPAVMKRLIGLLMPWYGASLGMGTTIASLGQESVRDVCERAGYGLLYNSFGGPVRTAADDLLDSGALAGVLLYRTKNEERLSQMLRSRNLPHIFLYRNLTGTPLNYVGIDFREAMRLAMEHFLDAGFSRVGALLGDTTFSSHAAFEHAFREEAARLRMDLNPDWVRVTAVSEEGGYAAMMGLMGARHRPQAVVCTSDKIAIGALRAAHQLKLAIPKSVALLTVDGTPATAFTSPAITSVTIPWREMFGLATRMLLELVERPASVQHVAVVMRCELVVRESTIESPPKPVTRAGSTGRRHP